MKKDSVDIKPVDIKTVDIKPVDIRTVDIKTALETYGREYAPDDKKRKGYSRYLVENSQA